MEFDESGKGRSLFGAGLLSIKFASGPGLLENLPTHAGLVWTDGQTSLINIEAFDQDGISLGITTGNHADSFISGTKEEDRF